MFTVGNEGEDLAQGSYGSGHHLCNSPCSHVPS
jgi:hypothetical protein